MDGMQTLDRGDGVKLAYSFQPGRGPTVVFLPGYKSDMAGTKAVDLAAFCTARGQAYLRLDYSGHGASGGDFMDGTIGVWLADALKVIDAATKGPLVLIGSSMGGWIALLAALALKERVAGLVGIAAAPDFSESLVWEELSFEERTEVMDKGFIMRPNPYGDDYPFTRALIEDGRTRLLLDKPIPLTCPVRMLHGQADNEVPWELSLRVAEQAESQDVRVVLVKDGDHRLSRPEDLALLRETVAGLL
jgi:pimeloyl-ACP methyl ester carboxylesterase